MPIKKHLAVTSLLGASFAALGQNSFIVEDLKVEGLQRVALGAALTHIPINVGDEVDNYTVSKTIKALFSSGHFDDISAFRDGNQIVFKVKERPTIASIEFDGNKDIKDEQLQESLDGKDIRTGETLDRTVIDGIEKGLIEFFHSIGKYNAKIEVSIVELPRNRVKLKFEFDEGDAASVRQINLVGNELFSDEQLLRLVESQQDLPWWKFLSSDRYQKQTIEGDLEKIRSYYLDRGYLRFNIDSTQVSVSPERESVYVTANISEGEKYTVKGFDFIGDLLGREELIKSVIPLKSGELYNGSLVTSSEEFIKSYLARFGYANAEVRTIPDIDDENKEVQLTLSVDPGKRVYVRRILVNGNQSTADHVVRREMTQLEGAWLSNQSLERSKLQIQRLPYMETVDFEVKPIPGVDDQVDIDFNVKEQPAGSFQAGVAYGSYAGLQFNVGVSESNFLGSGNQVAFNINTSKASTRYSVSYTDPYFTPDGISQGSSVFFSKFDGSEIGLIDYDSRSYGLGTHFGIPINPVNRLNFSFRWVEEELDRIADYEQTRVLRLSFLDLDDPAGGYDFTKYELGFGWSRITVNRGMFPTDGSRQNANFNITTPNSDLNYFKLSYDSRFYWPVSNDHRWVFSTRASLAYGNGYGEQNGFDQVLPFQEFYRITEMELRGFERNTILPRAVHRTPQPVPGTCLPDGTECGVIGGDPAFDRLQQGGRIGGNAKAVFGAEMIVPTPFLDEENTSSVRTSFFVDAANVWDTEFDVDRYANLPEHQYKQLSDFSDPSRFRVSTGMSIQWISPMGPMLISFAYPLKKEDDDDTKNISFNISNTF
ncbi:outer membrane protein assembly factor BamA [Pseudoalteromonas luteoviolacea]|uniref:Outer membrane protein assembly factor BamA n=1 Tax=Pseudoalteromonas luteoviolacea S4054 TaxID=1129367 RepID=A0A0F6AFR5_9GAMM|nr:outer membrane protein assembly factor BamA [Pseudoalteromonas luteoviolacea]AOT07541.1 outer membrane protein assembly factor BamA [Pseudoalteromonas luteoviolacea]AOT12457.1 outer membrane protein assembly factor BamA [Pseudoalteromonas luteoviolacea]AOT17371.1 outer membrane protein assembly factor BamA [Pseudoalteromonas luteoviolacea]KKE84646.1 outer membrane protein assembly factor YaeT [Pseudoalteromonas luteoviolacea S4054]KZN74254.1 outer membrane protein assembly factor YaeT [Pseu